MAAAKAARMPAPVPVSNRGGKRSFAPVPYTFVDESEVLTVEFAERRAGPRSYYAVAIQALIDGEQKVIRFESVACRGHVAARAKKLDVKLLYAEQGGKLYVKLKNPQAAVQAAMQAAMQAAAKRGIVPTFPPMTVRDAVRKAITEAPRTNTEICDRVREMLPDSDNATVHTTLSQLRAKNEVAKGDDLKWRLCGVAGKV